ncbi:hypothetical protein WDZ16_11395 [Pseudokineococcus marinus]|uniref:hypothetical protein n=1 Tax=Pseudokineococcus marinus TaxID=351215 RepID=UPI001BB2E9E7|nr:hypothetical protein [Pseudokineococcus marinus]
MARLQTDDLGCWVFKTSAPPRALAPSWRPGESLVLRRCVRPSYRLGLMAPGQRCLLWLSGRVDPGVHAVGVLVAGPDAEPAVEVELVLLRLPLARPSLAAASELSRAEVLRAPFGSNPSYLTPAQLAAVGRRLDAGTRRAAGWG